MNEQQEDTHVPLSDILPPPPEPRTGRGRRPGSKDKKKRIRRTKAEMEASKAQENHGKMVPRYPEELEAGCADLQFNP